MGQNAGPPVEPTAANVQFIVPRGIPRNGGLSKRVRCLLLQILWLPIQQLTRLEKIRKTFGQRPLRAGRRKPILGRMWKEQRSPAATVTPQSKATFGGEMKYRNQTWASPLLVALTVLALAVLDPGAVRANDVIVTIDTSAIANQNANLAFDFVAGGPPVFNTVSVSNFVTDAIQLSLSTTGSTTGGLPGDFSLDDTQFFNEVAGVFHLQNQISFDLQTTDAGPQPGSLPDEFSLFLLDPNTGNSLLNSSDPTGAGALLAIDLTGAGGPQVFDLSNAVTIGPDSPPSTVPEPASLYLLSG